MEPECTVCQLPWSSHPRGKQIPKDCKFCRRSVQGEPGEDEPEPQEDGDIHARLSRITLENKEIKAQLSQLMELVHQLLPKPSQVSAQSGERQAASPAQETAPASDHALPDNRPSIAYLDTAGGTRKGTRALTAPRLSACRATTDASPKQSFNKGYRPGSQGQQCTKGAYEPVMG